MNKQFLVKYSSAFPVNPDSAPFYSSPTHQQAVDKLVDGLRRGRRLQFLSGEPGSGKTSVLLYLKKRMESLRVIYVGHAYIGDYISTIFKELGLSEPETSDVSDEAWFSHLRAQLIDAGNPLLVVDNAEGFGEDDLKTVDTLSLKLSLPAIIAGNCDFTRLADVFDADASDFRQKVYRIGAMNGAEVGEYIRHRLDFAGAEEDVLTAAAIEQIHRYSEGNPRLVNLICNNALVFTGLEDKACVTPEIVDEVIRTRQSGGTYPFADAGQNETQTEAPAWVEEAAGGDDQGIFWPDQAAASESRHRDSGLDLGEPSIGHYYSESDGSHLETDRSSGDIPTHLRGEVRPNQPRRRIPLLSVGLGLLVVAVSGTYITGIDRNTYQPFLTHAGNQAQQIYHSGVELLSAAMVKVDKTLQPEVRRQAEVIRPAAASADASAAMVAQEDTAQGGDQVQPVDKTDARKHELEQTEKRIQKELAALEQLKSEISQLNERLETHLSHQAEMQETAQTTAKMQPVVEEGASEAVSDREAHSEMSDDDRAITRDQRRRLVQIYLERARYERDRRQLQRAYTTVAEGLALDPDNPDMLALQRSLSLRTSGR